MKPQYDCTKPLGDKLSEYLGVELDYICEEIIKNGIVFESQFKKLWSMVIKNNGEHINRILKDRTGFEISIAFSSKDDMFAFYNLNSFNNEEAIKRIEKYCLESF